MAGLRTFVLSLVILVGVGAGLYAALFWPWLRTPATPEPVRDAGWHMLELEAGLDQTPPGDPADLVKAELAIARQREALEALVSGVASNTTRGIPTRALPEEGRIALRSLEAWDRAGAGIGGEVCGASLDALPLLTAARLLLASAGTNPDAPEIGRALRLARALRQTGNLGHITLGFTLAEEATRWMQSRGQKATRTFVELAPREQEAWPALVRETICTWRSAARIAHAEGIRGLLAGLPGTAWPPAWVRPWVTAERELAALQSWQLDRMDSAREVSEDFHALQARMRLPPLDQLPHSALVRGGVRDPDESMERWREVLDRYQAFLKAAPPAKR